MAKPKVRLIQRPRLSSRFEAGNILYPSARIMGEYQREYDALLSEVWEAARPTILRQAKAMIERTESAAMDAAEDVPNGMLPGLQLISKQLEGRFLRIAEAMSRRMLVAVDKSATSNVNRSLKEISESVSVQYVQTDAVANAIQARIDANVRLITRIPERFLGMLSDDVHTAVTRGRGLADIQVKMAERYGTQSSWYKNVALDQVNKAYTAINTERMKEGGVSKFEWIHRPIAREPRHHHEISVSAGGLNGGVFDIDNPPVIDPRTGVRGLPGDLPFCHCIMRPVIEA